MADEGKDFINIKSKVTMNTKDIIEAWARIRKIDQTIPDDVLDFMKDSAIVALAASQSQEAPDKHSEAPIECYVRSDEQTDLELVQWKSLHGVIVRTNGGYLKKLTLSSTPAVGGMREKEDLLVEFAEYLADNGIIDFISTVGFRHYAKKWLEESASPAVDDWKAKYEKCIDVIKRFDAGIISMYDL
jgi:hypothetical protein